MDASRLHLRANVLIVAALSFLSAACGGGYSGGGGGGGGNAPAAPTELTAQAGNAQVALTVSRWAGVPAWASVCEKAIA